MLLIPCPWCGPRDETEFKYGGEAHIQRPSQPAEIDDAAWGDYVFMRANPAGLFLERWVHAAGCRRWFNVARDTVTNRVHASYRIGEEPPATLREGDEGDGAGGSSVAGSATDGGTGT